MSTTWTRSVRYRIQFSSIVMWICSFSRWTKGRWNLVFSCSFCSCQLAFWTVLAWNGFYPNLTIFSFRTSHNQLWLSVLTLLFLFRNLGFHFEVIVVVLKEKELSSLRKYNGNTVARRGLGCSDASRSPPPLWHPSSPLYDAALIYSSPWYGWCPHAGAREIQHPWCWQGAAKRISRIPPPPLAAVSRASKAATSASSCSVTCPPSCPNSPLSSDLCLTSEVRWSGGFPWVSWPEHVCSPILCMSMELWRVWLGENVSRKWSSWISARNKTLTTTPRRRPQM